MLEAGPIVSVPARRHPGHRLDGETGGRGHEPQLTRSETGRPEIEVPLGAAGVAQCGPLVVDAGGGVEAVSGFEEANGERDVATGRVYDGLWCGEFLEHVNDSAMLVDGLEQVLTEHAKVVYTFPSGPDVAPRS